MFEQETREEEEEHSSVVPYATMTTLLQLRAMKNKLNVAYLGSEMMKWNSSSTEIELKRIAVDLQRVYQNFGKEQANAYLLLARCRYFNQEFYRTILEGVKTASVTVMTERRIVARVSLLKFKAVVQKTNQKIPFLSRGGQQIQEAKNAWSKLLESHIKMLELRTNFLAIENAYKTATKRGHIIDQIIVPKTQATIKYIRVELEEMSREESHRMKMTSNKIQKCQEARRFSHYTKRVPRFKEVEDQNMKTILNAEKEPLPRSKSLIEEPKIINEKQYNSVILHKDIYEPFDRRILVKLKSQQVIRSLRNFYELVSLDSSSAEKEIEIPKKRLSLGDCNPFDSSMVNEASAAIEDFLEVCKDARVHLDNLTDTEQPCKVDSKLICNLKSHINAVIHTNSKLQSTVLAPSIRDFVQSCGKIDIKLKIANTDLDQTPLDEGGKKIVNNLVKSIDDVVNIITECKVKGLLTPSLEEFSKIFNEAKYIIGDKVKKISHRKQKLDYLKQIVSDIEKLTWDIRREGTESTSKQQLLKSCKAFKMRLEEHKKLMPRSQRRMIEAQKDDSFITESILIFILSCEDYIKNAKCSKYLTPDMSSQDKIISKISQLMTKWQREGILNKSTMEFMKNAKNRWTIDSSRIYDTNSTGRFILAPQNDEYKSVNFLTTLNKTIAENITSNFTVPPSQCMFQNSLKPENCLLIMKTTDNSLSHPAVERSIFANKKVEKSAETNVELKKIPLKPDVKYANEDFKQTMQYTQYSYGQSLCCNLSKKSVSVGSKNDANNGSKQSEMIVAEISAYDSCPAMDTSYKDIWLLETCMDNPSTTEADIIRDSIPGTSVQSIDKLTCLVYDKEKSVEQCVKRTYTM